MKKKISKMTNDELQKLTDQAEELYQQNKWDDCIALLTKYISLQDDPHSQSAAYCNRGAVYSKKDEHDRAIEDYNKAIELDINNINAYRNRGSAYRKKDEYDQTIEDFNKAIGLDTSNAAAYLNRGSAYRKKDEYDRAIEDFNKAIGLDTSNVDGYLSRGIVYGIKGEHDLAIEDFDKALSLNPNDADGYLSRGIAYGIKGEYDLAFKDILCAVKKDKNLISLHSGAYVAKHIKDIFEDDKKGVKSFKLFTDLYTEIEKIKWVLFLKSKECKEVAHYTSLHTLKKLATKEECFRLYNAGYMNDPEEGRAFFDVMEEQKCGIDVESLFYSSNKEAPSPSSAYIGSFVIVDSTKDKEQDKDKLFLWRTYGKHDLEEVAGACLIFKHEETHFAKHPPFEISAMSQLVNTEAMSRQQPSKPALYEIAYLSDCKKKGGKKELVVALGKLVKPLEAVVSFYNGSEANQKDALAKLVRELLDDIRFLFKADHYTEEREVRVVKMDYSETEQTDIQIDMEQFPPRFYLEIPKDCRFHEVILGPQTRRVSEWERWLKKRGVENVRQSGIQYRTQ